MKKNLHRLINSIKQLAQQARPRPTTIYTYAQIYRLYFRGDVNPVTVSKLDFIQK